jgi:hypothetical protein
VASCIRAFADNSAPAFEWLVAHSMVFIELPSRHGSAQWRIAQGGTRKPAAHGRRGHHSRRCGSTARVRAPLVVTAWLHRMGGL